MHRIAARISNGPRSSMAAMPLLLDVAGDDAGERAAQVRGQLVRAAGRDAARSAAIDSCVTSNGCWKAGGICSSQLKLYESSAGAAASAHWLNPADHLARRLGRVADDELQRCGASSPRVPAMKLADLLEVSAVALRGPVNTTGSGCVGIGRVEQDAQQVEDLLGRAHAAREHHDAMRQAHEGLQALFDVRHDHQLVDDRVRRFGGDDAGLGDADVAAAAMRCLAWPMVAPFIGPFIAPGPQPVHTSRPRRPSS